MKFWWERLALAVACFWGPLFLAGEAQIERAGYQNSGDFNHNCHARLRHHTIGRPGARSGLGLLAPRELVASRRGSSLDRRTFTSQLLWRIRSMSIVDE
jgi:hypothetical protein